ncbi:MFS transporter [Mumia sp.]|uniref:MFS transporter n=1 Tax=Mumia sp. TaxID=1965300 RepID=UPI00260C2E91|nr:MFS transporter [Mumia sp.]MDD9349194.1 MFS transporter [Mumia sp.]
MTTTSTVPPFARDRMVHGWFVVKGVSDAGDAAWIIALAWTAVQLASPAVAGLVVAAGTLPRAAALLVGGAVADRFDVRRILTVTTAARVLVLLGTIAVAVLAGESIALLAVAAIGFGLCDAIFEPAAVTLGRHLVREDDLSAYGGASQTSARLGAMTGAAIGGGLVAFGGLTVSAALNAITYLGVLGYLAVALRLRFPMPRMDPAPVLRAIGEGFGHLRTTRTTRTLVITLSGLNLAVGPALGLGLALRVRDAEWGAGTLGVLQALVACGALVGGAVMIRWQPHRPAPLAFTLLVVQGLAIVLLATPTVLVTATSCVIIGLTAGAASALLYAVFVRSVAPQFLGRLGSIQRLGDDCLMPAAMATFGAVAGGVSLAGAFGIFGGMMSVLMVVALTRSRVAAPAATPCRPLATGATTGARRERRDLRRRC